MPDPIIQQDKPQYPAGFQRGYSFNDPSPEAQAYWASRIKQMQAAGQPTSITQQDAARAGTPGPFPASGALPMPAGLSIQQDKPQIPAAAPMPLGPGLPLAAADPFARAMGNVPKLPSLQGMQMQGMMAGGLLDSANIQPGDPGYAASRAGMLNGLSNGTAGYNSLLANYLTGSHNATSRELGLGNLGVSMANTGINQGHLDLANRQFDYTKSPQAQQDALLLGAAANGGLDKALELKQGLPLLGIGQGQPGGASAGGAGPGQLGPNGTPAAGVPAASAALQLTAMNPQLATALKGLPPDASPATKFQTIFSFLGEQGTRQNAPLIQQYMQENGGLDAFRSSVRPGIGGKVFNTIGAVGSILNPRTIYGMAQAKLAGGDPFQGQRNLMAQPVGETWDRAVGNNPEAVKSSALLRELTRGR